MPTIEIEPAPRCDAGDTEAARRYVQYLETLLVRHRDLTHSQYNRVYHGLPRWRRRAAGLDARFNIVGNVPGRWTYDVEWKIWKMQRAIDGTDATTGGEE